MNGRSWKIVLVASLVLNVFVLGAIVGGAYQWFAAHGADCAGAGATARAALRRQTLSAERQKAFIDGLKECAPRGPAICPRRPRRASRSVASARGAAVRSRGAGRRARPHARGRQQSARASGGQCGGFRGDAVARGAGSIRRQPESCAGNGVNRAGGQCGNRQTGESGGRANLRAIKKTAAAATDFRVAAV